jgi:nucleoid-associated protein YgaU
MFDSALDSEQTFVQHGTVARTRVRRRRLALLVGATALVLGLAARGAQALGQDEIDRDRPDPLQHVVQAGDTLWSIAVPMSEGSDPRMVVDAIERANGIQGRPIVPGQRLRIPTDA